MEKKHKRKIPLRLIIYMLLGAMAFVMMTAQARPRSNRNVSAAAAAARTAQPHHASPAITSRVMAGLEPLAGLPEPQAIFLLGTALLITANVARRRILRTEKVSED